MAFGARVMQRGVLAAAWIAGLLFPVLQSAAQTPPSKGSLPDPAQPAQPWPPPSSAPPAPSTAPPAPPPSSSAAPAPTDSGLPAQPAPPQQPQPPGPYTYPPPYYPPPGYYYPPGYYQPYSGGYGGAYPYGYEQPKPKPQYPDDASIQTSPYVDLLAGGIALDQRYDQFLAVGVQGGLYLGGRVRLAVRGLLLTEPSGDNIDAYNSDLLASGYSPIESDKATFIYGASLGAAPLVKRNFLFAPGISFMRSNVSDYGSFLGLSVPFEWVTDDGMRIGFEVVLGRAFGGVVRSECKYTSSSCQTGDQKDVDRPGGTGFYAAFEIGWGFNHPPPKPATSGQNP